MFFFFFFLRFKLGRDKLHEEILILFLHVKPLTTQKKKKRLRIRTNYFRLGVFA